jgi:hypothetical protein
MTQQNKFNPLQLELLRLYAGKVSDEDLLEIKKMLGQYFANKLRSQVDKAIKDKGISLEDLDKWANE